jgi:hypothetical protein
VAPKLFDDDEVARLVAAHDRLWAGQDDYAIPSMYGVILGDPASPALRQQVDAFWRNAEMRRAILSPVIGKIGARLMGARSARLWHDQALYANRRKEVTNAGQCGLAPGLWLRHSCSTTQLARRVAADNEQRHHAHGGRPAQVGASRRQRQRQERHGWCAFQRLPAASGAKSRCCWAGEVSHHGLPSTAWPQPHRQAAPVSSAT